MGISGWKDPQLEDKNDLKYHVAKKSHFSKQLVDLANWLSSMRPLSEKSQK